MSPNRNYISGRNFEYAYRKTLMAEGFLVIRASGSHGPFDLVGIKAGTPVQLVQCKVCQDVATATRIIKAFKKNPPLTVLVDDHPSYIQSIVIKVKGVRALMEEFAL